MKITKISNDIWILVEKIDEYCQYAPIKKVDGIWSLFQLYNNHNSLNPKQWWAEISKLSIPWVSIEEPFIHEDSFIVKQYEDIRAKIKKLIAPKKKFNRFAGLL